MEDAHLIDGLSSGRDWAYRALIQQYQNRLLRIAYAITLDREESADIVQEVFIKAFENIATYRREAGLFTWLRRITVNQSLNWKRTWKRRFKWAHQPLEPRDDDDKTPEIGTHDHNPEEALQHQELGRQVQRALSRLPADARAVFILKELEGLSYDEIALELDIQKGTVSSRLFYARQKLQTMLAQQYREVSS